jgi:gliding motility-associated-like protein
MVIINVSELKLQIPNVFTPNSDGINDRFEIPKLEEYLGNEIVIFNRWGQKVYERSNYGGDWDGSSLPDGTYFYILNCDGYFRDDVFRGSITILGSNY